MGKISAGVTVNRRSFALLTGLAVSAAGLASAAVAEEPPTTWDGLVRVPSKKLKLVYLAPGADFRPYTQVMLDPTEVAFSKKWINQYNLNAEDLNNELQQSDIRDAVRKGVKKSDAIFSAAFTTGGYPVVTAAGRTVLRVRTAIINIRVTAPDPMTSDVTMSGAGSAGQATFVVEARDSQTDAIMGRAIDEKLAGDTGFFEQRSSASNWADFDALIKTWAKSSVVGLNELKTLSPVKAHP
jgi:hypothetical protein